MGIINTIGNVVWANDSKHSPLVKGVMKILTFNHDIMMVTQYEILIDHLLLQAVRSFIRP